MGKLDGNKLGLILGAFLALMHAIWSFFVGVIPGTLQQFLDWVFKLHSLQPVYVILSFNIVNAIFLLIVAFIAGYVYGWLFATTWNWIKK
jgi:hypothetical protein